MSKENVAKAVNNIIQEVQISDTLLKGKQQLTKSTTKIINELNNIWYNFMDNAEFGELIESSQEQLGQCTKLGSLWVLRQTPPIEQFYEIHEVIGTPGAYGIVKRYVDMSTKKEYAVKQIKKFRYNDKELQRTYFSDLRSEVYLMTQAHDHPNIVECYAVFEDINTLYVVLEYCKGGELYSLITEERNNLNERMAADLFRQMTAAIYYLHSLGIAHCDLKPENFVFRDQQKKHLVLIDFGMAKIVNFRKYFKAIAGSPYYVAPEVLKNHYKESCDVWSLGISLFLLIFGYVPFFDRKDDEKVVYRKILKGFSPKVQQGYGAYFPASLPVSDCCKDIISRMLRSNCADRLTAEEVLAHPFLKLNDQNGNEEINVKLQKISNPAILNSLRFYKKKGNVLRQQVLTLLAKCNYLNTNQRNALKEFFSAADEDKDNNISKKELFAALKEFDKDITEEDVDNIFETVDLDKNGFVSYEELLSTRINRKLQSKETRLRKVFQSLDFNKDGTITVQELEAAWQSVTNTSKKSQDFQTIIAEVDKNGDGKIDYEEFLSAFGKSESNTQTGTQDYQTILND